MSSLYLLDGHTTPLSNTPILDVLYGGTTPVPFPGGFMVRVEDDVRVRNPTDLYTPGTGLIPQKYASMLANQPGFTRIVADDMLDALDIDLVTSGPRGTKGGSYGDRATNKLRAGQQVRTIGYTLPITPAQVVVSWECFKTSYARDPASPTDRWTPTYQTLPSTALTVDVSFNGGSTWTSDYASPLIEGGLLPIPAIHQGTQLVVLLTATQDCGLGGWAIIY